MLKDQPAELSRASRTAELIHSGLGAGGVRLASIGISLLLSIVLARSLGPANFGHYAFVTTLIYVLSLPIGQALMQLVTREASAAAHANDGARLNDLIRWGRKRIAIVAAAVALVVIVVALPRAQWEASDRWTLLLLVAPAVPFIGGIALRAGILAGFKRVVVAQVAELLVRPSTQLAIVGCALLAGVLDASLAALGFTFAAVAGFAAVAVFSRGGPHQAGTESSSTSSARWSRAWLPFVLLFAASALNAQLGVLLLGWLASSEQVGAMQIAEQGSRLVALSLTIVNMVIGPYIARAWQDSDRQQLQALSLRSARVAILVALPVAMPLVLLAAPVIKLVFGADYVSLAAAPLAILAGAQLVNVAFGSVGLLLTMSGHERDALMGLAIALVLNVIVAILLIPRYGATGAAVASALGLIAWNVLLALRVRQRVGVRPGAL